MERDTLLVPVDYTGCAYEVADRAADLAGRLGADVVLLYVVNLPTGLTADTRIGAYGQAELHRALTLLDEEARQSLEDLAPTFQDRGAGVRVAVEHGDIGDAILRTSEAVGASMIVMGTHGRRGLRRLVEGSVAESVIRRATCPVLTVRTQAPELHSGPTPLQEQARAEAEG